MSPSLFDEIYLGDLKLKNRVAMAPMTRGRAGESRVPNELMAEYYLQRASAGLLISEATVISRQGIGWIGSPGIYTAEMVEGWQKVTGKAASAGTPIFLQLWHCGRASHSDFHNGDLPVSASAVKLQGDHIHTPSGAREYETPRPLSTDEIGAIVEDYATAARNAKDAGFAGIEVHSANGYLLNQFLDSKTNLRTDEYGGSVENKYRFLGEVLEAVMKVWPSTRVGVRLSPNGIFNDMGHEDFRETYLYVIQTASGAPTRLCPYHGRPRFRLSRERGADDPRRIPDTLRRHDNRELRGTAGRMPKSVLPVELPTLPLSAGPIFQTPTLLNV